MSDDDNNNSGGHSLGGGPAESLPQSWAQPSSARRIGRIGEWSGSSSNANAGGIRSLSDLNSAGGGGRAPPRQAAPNSDDEDDDGEEGQSWFAGGERSGLNIQNPDRPNAAPGGRLVRDILRRAAEHGSAPGPQAAPTNSSFFGGGHTLGSDETPSEFIADPNAPPEGSEEVHHRTLHLWRNGFSIADGELKSYEEDRELLAQLLSNNPPHTLFDVPFGARIDILVEDKRGSQDYVASKKAFAGGGYRLGAPVPGVEVSASSAMPGSFPSSSSSSSPVATPTRTASVDSVAPKFAVDQTQPTTSVQIRLADGTRMVCRMNLTHTVLDLRNFINASRPENLTRPYTIGTTFPNRTLEDNTATIQAAGLENSVVVQRWS